MVINYDQRLGVCRRTGLWIAPSTVCSECSEWEHVESRTGDAAIDALVEHLKDAHNGLPEGPNAPALSAEIESLLSQSMKDGKRLGRMGKAHRWTGQVVIAIPAHVLEDEDCPAELLAIPTFFAHHASGIFCYDCDVTYHEGVGSCPAPEKDGYPDSC